MARISGSTISYDILRFLYSKRFSLPTDLPYNPIIFGIDRGLDSHYKMPLAYLHRMNKPYVIGVSGGSGSGKTTLIKVIREMFDPSQVAIVLQDDYYKLRENQKIDKKGFRNFDRPKSIRKKEFERDLKKIIGGESLEVLEYTYNNEKKKQNIKTVHPAPVILIEGLFVLHYKKIRELCDLKIFVDAKENIKVIRRIKRDRQERNYPLEDVLYRYEHHVLPSYEKYIKPYASYADLVFNNNENLDVATEILATIIKSKLPG